MQVRKPDDLAKVRLTRFGNIFVDSVTGWHHLCDASCDLQAPDEDGARSICPLTGRIHGRLDADEACAAGAAAAGADALAEQDAPAGVGTLLLRALRTVMPLCMALRAIMLP